MKLLKFAGFLGALNVGLTSFDSNVVREENEVYKKINCDLITTGVDSQDDFWDSRSLSFAKINLTLSIDPDSKASDRYLKLCSLMQKVTWGNEIFIKRISNEESQLVSKKYTPTHDGDYLLLIDDTPKVSGDKSQLTIANFPFDSSNILAKTLTRVRKGSENYIVLTRKVVPIGTGLGGGSCDAAVVLNRLCKGDSLKEAATIGSDVPFLTHHCNTAIVSGTGDEIYAVDLDWYNDWIYILIPQEFTSTKDVFRKARELLSSGRFKENTRLFTKNVEFTQNLLSGGTLGLSKTLGNDLEECIINENVSKLYDTLKGSLNEEFFGMSGSGSSFLVIGANDDTIKRIRQTYGKPLVVVKTRFRHKNEGHLFDYLKDWDP